MDQDKPARKAFKRVIGNAGRWLVVIGAMLLGTYLAARIHAAGMSREASAEPAPAKLPKTGSVFPAVGLAGALMVSLGLALRLRTNL